MEREFELGTTHLLVGGTIIPSWVIESQVSSLPEFTYLLHGMEANVGAVMQIEGNEV